MTKTMKPRMPLVMLKEPGMYLGGFAYCGQPTDDAGTPYCANPAVWYHWAESKRDRDYFACSEHVGNLNYFYSQEYQDEVAKLVAARTK